MRGASLRALEGVGSAPGSWEQVYDVVRSTDGRRVRMGWGLSLIEVPQVNERDDSK